MFYRVMKIIAGILAAVVIGINMYFVVVYIQELPNHWAIYLAIAVLLLFYFVFLLYLVSTCRCIVVVSILTNQWIRSQGIKILDVSTHHGHSRYLNFFHLLTRKPNLEKLSIYSSKFFYNFHLSESSFNCFGQVG